MRGEICTEMPLGVFGEILKSETIQSQGYSPNFGFPLLLISPVKHRDRDRDLSRSSKKPIQSIDSLLLFLILPRR